MRRELRPLAMAGTASGEDSMSDGIHAGFVLRKKNLRLPACSAYDRHLLGHLLWSPERMPRKVPKYMASVVRAVEDARVNGGMRALGYPCYVRFTFDPEHYTTPREALLSALYTTAHEAVYYGCSDWRLRDIEFVMANLEFDERGPVSTFKDVLEIAHCLGRSYSEYERGETVRPHMWMHPLFLVEPDEEDKKKRKEKGKDDGEDGASKTDAPSHTSPDYCNGTDGFGDMEIVTPPLVRHSHRSVKYFKKVHYEEGAIPRAVHRLPVDQRVFLRRLKQNIVRATMLIDISGSMRFSASQLDALCVQTSSVFRVATYSGNNDTEVTGKLSIVADDRLCAREVDIHPKGHNLNIIDLPALRWLATQPAPRYWVSDGRVTGKHETRSTAMDNLCHATARAAGIEQVFSIPLALDKFGVRT